MRVRAEVVNALSEYLLRDGVGFDYKILKTGETVRGIPDRELRRILTQELGLTSVTNYQIWDYRRAGFTTADDAVRIGTRGQRTKILVVRR